MKIRVTAEAERVIDRIAELIAQDNPERALFFTLELRGKYLDLAATRRGRRWSFVTRASGFGVGFMASP